MGQLREARPASQRQEGPSRDAGIGIPPHMLHVLLCVFTRMLPGMSRALELILAEADLPAGGADSQGSRAELEGTSLPLGCGVHMQARADPRAVSGQTVSQEGLGVQAYLGP